MSPRPRDGAPQGPAPEARRRPAPRKPCYDQALVLLAQRSHFAAELRTKLCRRGHEPPEVERVIDRLRRDGYLDDRRTAEEWVRVRRRRGDGPRRLLAGLGRLGVDRSIITELVPSGGEDDTVRALELAKRWLSRHQSGPEGPDVSALARHLDRRGFGRRAILSVLDELQAPSHDGSLDEADEADEADAG